MHPSSSTSITEVVILDNSPQNLYSTKMEYNPLATNNGGQMWQAERTNQQIDEGDTLMLILEEVRSLKEQIETNNEEYKQNIQELTEEIKALRSELSDLKTQYADPVYKLLPEMPFNSLEALKNFDEKILLDDELREELKTFLHKIEGKEFGTYLRNALRAVCTDELAIDLTWRGTPEKPSVQTFTVFMIIRDLCHAKFENAAHSEIVRKCQQHFLHAKDRVMKKCKSSLFTTSRFGKDDEVKPVVRSAPSHWPDPPSPSSGNLSNLPFTTLADLEEFDTSLNVDGRLKADLKNFIKKIGGKDYATFVRAAFRAILTDDLAMELSWKGTKDKASIQDFKIFFLIKKACNAKFEDVNVSDVNKIIQQHFLHAKDRVMKRARAK